MKLELYELYYNYLCKEMAEGTTSGFSCMNFPKLKTEVDMTTRDQAHYNIFSAIWRPRTLALEVDPTVPTVGLEGMKTTYSILFTNAVLLVAEV